MNFVTHVVAFLAGFCVAFGLLVLIGARDAREQRRSTERLHHALRTIAEDQ